MIPRFLALVFPSLPIEVARRSSPDLSGKKLALIERKGGSLRVAFASREAEADGATAGSTYAHALAAAPGLVAREHRPEETREALLALARWASFEIAPRAAACHERRAVLVPVGGTALVHGEESRLLARALASLRSLGHEARGAIADTPLAALALALVESEALSGPIAKPGETRAALEPLPVAALGLEEDALASLASVGVRTIGELLALPRRSLPSRFGEATLERLDRALGRRPDPLSPPPDDEEIRERLELEGGTDRQEDLALAIEFLSRRAVARLAATGRAARALELVFSRENADPVRFSSRLASPVARARTIEKILRERLERLDLSLPVTAIELALPETARRVEVQGELFSSQLRSGEHEELASLLARLEARIGPRRVLRAVLSPDHRPERAWASRPATDSAKKTESALVPGRRPTRLLARPRPIVVFCEETGVPVRFLQGDEERALARAIGPERLETGFWDGEEARRDYWIVADERGRESWIFRDLGRGGWFLHGIFD